MDIQGVWNLFREIAPAPERWEILDWYHLKENLYKVGGSQRAIDPSRGIVMAGEDG